MNDPIGYQLQDSNGEIPEGSYSFEIFPLKFCLAFCQAEPHRWLLLPIWENDVEEPTIYDADTVDLLARRFDLTLTPEDDQWLTQDLREERL